MSVIEATMSKVVVACALAVLGGCMSEVDLGDADTHTVRRLEIKGGTTDSEHTSVVGILVNLGSAQAICSGTLIAPNLVLTAQHCVAQLTSPYVICGQTPFGAQFPPESFFVTTQTTLPQSTDGYYRVDAVHVPPGGNDTCGYDIALLELSENVPANVTEPIVPRIDEPVLLGETYTAVGYGHIGDDTGAGTRRQLAGREVLCSTGDCPQSQGIHLREFAGTDGTCQGDSGGAPIDSKGRVLGALSRGPEGCAGSVYSSVSAWSDWMRDIGASAATAGGYAAPLWVTDGISEPPVEDPDLDDVLSASDNCPEVTNADQLDLDADGAGDVCDDDIDGDGVLDDADNCPLYVDATQADNDADSFGNVCDLDDDNDGVVDDADNCRFVPNASQENVCFGEDSSTTDPGAGASGDGNTFTGTSTGANAGVTGGDGPNVQIIPEPIHLEGRMSCSVGGGRPQDFGVLALLFLGTMGIGRRRRR